MRYWSILFAWPPSFVVGAFVYAAVLRRLVAAQHRRASRTTSISTFGREIDSLFLIILWITGIVFIGTQIVLVWAMLPVRRRADAQGRPVRKADYFHGSQRLEVIWTIIPAAILVFIALYQMGTWAEIKFRSAAPKVPPLAEITGAAVPVGDALSRPRRQAEHPRRPRHRQRPALRQGQDRP